MRAEKVHSSPGKYIYIYTNRVLVFMSLNEIENYNILPAVLLIKMNIRVYFFSKNIFQNGKGKKMEPPVATNNRSNLFTKSYAFARMHKHLKPSCLKHFIERFFSCDIFLLEHLKRILR